MRKCSGEITETSRRSVLVPVIVLGAWLSGTAVAQTDITFPDPNLEVAVRVAIGKTTGQLTSTDVEALTSLTACHGSITNLTGLEWAANLSGLSLSGNSITDLSPLARLSNLTNLNLGDNGITNGS